MKRQLILALASSALATGVLAGSASAGAPVGGCPSGADWYLILPVHQPQPADKNGDGWLCRRDLNADLGGAFGGGFTFFDNVVREQ